MARMIVVVLVALVASILAQAPFPGTSPCQRCANNPNGADCAVAYKGTPGQYCYPWLSSGVKQACCCPLTAKCGVQPLKSDSCGCNFAPAPPAPPAPLFPGTSACQRCANNPGGPDCAVAFKNLPGKYCGPWLSGGVKQACCCPVNAGCAISPRGDACGCTSTPIKATSKPSKKTPFWAWILIGLGVLMIAAVVFWCCCRYTTVPDETIVLVEQPVKTIVPPMYSQPVVVHQQPGYNGYDVAAGTAMGAAVGVVGGVAIGTAIAGGRDHDDSGEGSYSKRSYEADFAGDF
ncbi:hypothetical protein AeMF1_000891 [Aphanomyces euteiches]|nr:hypothetical protein AeMF1_000891 [Aphanomyces euteiches]KAH9183235.1 hypothetical protein AeNC1_014791 [Aphanomyces euteiches]